MNMKKCLIKISLKAYTFVSKQIERFINLNLRERWHVFPDT